MGKGVTFSGMFGKSWDTFLVNFELVASIGLLFSFLPNIVFNIWNLKRVSQLAPGITPSFSEVLGEIQTMAPWWFVLSLFSIFLSISLIYALNAGSKKNVVNFSSTLKGGWSFYGKGLFLFLLLFIFLVPLYLLLIIPGIIFTIYWIFAICVLVVEKSSAMDSLKKSRQIVKGRWWKVFGYILLLYIILAIFSAVIGIIFNRLGVVGIFLESALMALVSIFSLIFINTFYLNLKK